MVDCIPELQVDGGAQCFPLYLYEEQAEEASTDRSLFDTEDSAASRRDAIIDTGLAHFREAYPGEAITKEDLFYYITACCTRPTTASATRPT